jgi:GNAT superfamily N-acetyltransferase
MTELPKLLSKIDIADSSNIDKIVADTYIDPAILERWKTMIKNNELVLLALLRGDNYVGRVNLWLAPADEAEINIYYPGTPLINAFQVNEGEQGKGLGTQLLSAAHDILRQRGYSKVGLGVEPNNAGAIRLYEKLGYVQKKLGDSAIYKSSWDETKPDGSVQKFTVDTLFMLKEL